MAVANGMRSVKRQTETLRHIAVLARDGDPGKAAALDFPRDL